MPKGHPSHSTAEEAAREPRVRREGQLFVVVIGCGRLGSLVANRLSFRDHHVTVVDQRSGAFDALAPEYSGFRLEGDATEFATLREADIGQADVLIIATENDNINLMVGQVARKIFNVQRVIARVSEPRREEVFSELGIETICPAVLVGDEIVESLHRDRSLGRQEDS